MSNKWANASTNMSRARSVASAVGFARGSSGAGGSIPGGPEPGFMVPLDCSGRNFSPLSSYSFVGPDPRGRSAVAEPNEPDPPRNRPWERGGSDRDRDRDDNDPPRRRRYEDDDDFDDRPRRRRPGGPEPVNGLATAALILGILALCTGPLLGIPALICGAIAMGRPGGRTAS